VLSFAALAVPTRRAIIARLAMGETTVSELAKPFDMSGLCHLVAQLAPRARRASVSSAR